LAVWFVLNVYSVVVVNFFRIEEKWGEVEDRLDLRQSSQMAFLMSISS